MLFAVCLKGDLLGLLCKVNGDYPQVEQTLIELIRKHIDGDFKKREAKQQYKNEKKVEKRLNKESVLGTESVDSDSDTDSGDSDDSDLSDYEYDRNAIPSNESDYELNEDGIKIIRKLSVNVS